MALYFISQTSDTSRQQPFPPLNMVCVAQQQMHNVWIVVCHFGYVSPHCGGGCERVMCFWRGGNVRKGYEAMYQEQTAMWTAGTPRSSAGPCSQTPWCSPRLWDNPKREREDSEDWVCWFYWFGIIDHLQQESSGNCVFETEFEHGSLHLMYVSQLLCHPISRLCLSFTVSFKIGKAQKEEQREPESPQSFPVKAKLSFAGFQPNQLISANFFNSNKLQMVVGIYNQTIFLFIHQSALF